MFMESHGDRQMNRKKQDNMNERERERERERED